MIHGNRGNNAKLLIQVPKSVCDILFTYTVTFWDILHFLYDLDVDVDPDFNEKVAENYFSSDPVMLKFDTSNSCI